MSKGAFAVIASLLVAIALGAIMIREPTSTPGASSLAADDPDSSASLEQRVQQLEQVIAQERDARLVLEDELIALYAQIEGIETVRGNALEERATQRDAAQRQANSQTRRRDPADRMRIFQERRLAQLVDGGFSEDEAQRLLKLESEAQYKALQANYEAQRQTGLVDGRRVDALSANLNPQSILRNELGDSGYERYLAAQGQRTTVQISNILDGSPGSQAGLQPGDEIVSYNGRRTFSILDVREQAFQGEAGESVVIEIDRNGVRMQLSIPRGPIGMNGNGASIRNFGRWGG